MITTQMPESRISAKELINELREFENIANFQKYCKLVYKVLEKYSFKYKDAGVFTEVYFNDSPFVVKICMEKVNLFHEKYCTGYLKPIYVSKNRWLAIQPKAVTKASIGDDLASIREDLLEVSRQFKQLQDKRDKLIQKKTEILAKSKLLKEENVKNRDFIWDIHGGNIGLWRGNVYMVDLNNQMSTTHSAT